MGPLARSVLYLRPFHHPRLALKLFRGEPAITGFDWLFTPTHSSSQDFSTSTWFGPPLGINPASPWPWVDHPASGRHHGTHALFGLAFAAAPGLKPLTSHRDVTRRSVLQKVRRHPALRPRAPTVCRRTVSGSISLPFRGAFHLSLTVLCAIGRQWVFSLGGWSPQLPTGFHVSRGTQGICSVRFSLSPTRLSRSMAGLSRPLRLGRPAR